MNKLSDKIYEVLNDWIGQAQGQETRIVELENMVRTFLNNTDPKTLVVGKSENENTDK